MTQYIVSARKYRPDNFESLVGQDNIAQTLKNSILRGQLAHAYLFCGPRGVGKTSTARIFAKTINCSSPTADMEPCGKCESCISFAEGRSYCIHELDAASNNGVDDIKALMDQVRVPPQVGKYSVYIIDEVHMLSQAAFNAFLKTLEEPPAHAIFILATTEKHKILPTILSRCQTYDFNRITTDNIVKNLRFIAESENVRIDDESLHVIAEKADGAMRDALTIFDQTVAFCGTDINCKDVMRNLNVLDYEYSFGLVNDFLSGNYPSALLKFDEILTKGFNALHFVAALSTHFRNLVVAKGAGLDALLELPDSLKERYRQQAAQCSLKFLYDALGVTTLCESGYRASVNPRLHIEFALMKLCFLVAAPSAAPAVAPAAPASVPSATPAAAPVSASVQSPAAAPVVSAPTASQPAPTPATPVASSVASDSAAPAPAAASAAPAAAAQPAQPAPRRARAAGKATLSVKSIVDASQAAAPATGAAAAHDSVPGEDALTEKWKELAGMYSSKPRLASTILSSHLEFGSQDGSALVTFKVANEAQKKWIEERCLHELEGNYRRLLNSSKVLLRVDIVPEEEKAPEPYTPSEKAKVLMADNPEVKNFVSDFGLDIK